MKPPVQAHQLLLLLALGIAGCAARPGVEQPLFNTITWSTASELDNFGFDVFRGLSESGPFVRLTPQPVPGAGTTDVTQSYEFVDDSIEPGVVYFYYVEAISLAGVRERFTPVFPSRPKYRE